MPAVNSRAVPSAKRATPAERAEECHAEQVRLKEAAAQRREQTPEAGGKAARAVQRDA